MRLSLYGTSLAVAAALFFFPVAAEAQDPLLIPRLDGPIELDGRSDEPAWQAIEPLPVTMHVPTFGAVPSERTEFRVAHDDDYLYVAGRLYDSDPGRIRANSLKRDDASFVNDVFIVALDTFNDKENALVFGTTPAGLRTDVAVGDDGTAYNFSWDTYWDVEVSRDEEGWFAEMRIPFSSLRFQDEDGRVEMGVTVTRGIARKSEVIIFPAIPPNWGQISQFKMSRAREVVLQGISSRRPLYVTPYVLGGAGRSSSLNDAGTGYTVADTPAREIGIDLKYGLTSNLTLDLTANPDFAQVEADNQQVNLTRFSLFFPEQRLFFQEGSRVFEYSLGGFNRLFYSRRIGLHHGQAVPIHGGARVVGRVGSWDVGALNMQTDGIETRSSENFGVLRVKRRMLNENSYMGGILTTRMSPGGGYNLAYGVDGTLRLFGQDYLTFNLAQTLEDEYDAPVGALDRAAARGRWERRGVDGLIYALDVSRLGKVFQPGAGFILRDDYTRLGDRISYGWRPGEESVLLRHTLALNGSLYRRNEDGSMESWSLAPEWELETKSGHTITVGGETAYEDLEHGFHLSPVAEIPAGSYRFSSARLAYVASAASLFRTGASVEAGSFYDGWKTSVAVTPSWNASRHLELSGGYEFNHVSLPERAERFNAHLARLSARVAVNVRLSASSFVQYSSAADAVTTNFRLRYNPREGRDLYLVYNHGLNTNRHRLDPYLPLTDSRTLLIKYSHALDLGF